MESYRKKRFLLFWLVVRLVSWLVGWLPLTFISPISNLFLRCKFAMCSSVRSTVTLIHIWYFFYATEQSHIHIMQTAWLSVWVPFDLIYWNIQLRLTAVRVHSTSPIRFDLNPNDLVFPLVSITFWCISSVWFFLFLNKILHPSLTLLFVLCKLFVCVSFFFTSYQMEFLSIQSLVSHKQPSKILMTIVE